MKRLYLIFFYTLITSTLSYAQMEFIPLNHQSPQAIVEKVKPFLSAGETIIAGHNEIIVSADPTKIKDILKLVNKLDQAAHRLLILVNRDGKFNDKKEGYQANIAGNVSIGVESSSSVSGRANIYNSQDVSNDKSTDQIRVLDGYPAFIANGVSEPMPVIQIQQNGVYSQITTGTEYHDSSKGFYVTPRLSRESVVLEISPWKESPLSKNRIGAKYERLSTIIRGPLNTWIALSGIDEATKQSQSNILGRHYQTLSSRHNIWVKVIDLDGKSKE